MKNWVLLLLIVLLHINVVAQTTISGTIYDGSSNETLIGATVTVKGTTEGTSTDYNGKFEFTTSKTPPFTLEVSFIGYETKDVAYLENMIGRPLKVKISSSAEKLGVIEIVDVRIAEKLQESPLTIESMGLKSIKETPSASFYTGLGNLKGVDLTTASLGFVVINTRGFNSTRPVRSLQLVDGADNQAPGLNFSLGNFAGSSELDIQKVELIVGASSAMFGPNAFNGVINMQTKNPFYHKGLSVMVKGGERNLFEGAFRYARAFKNKAGEDKFAFKVNFSYLRADDWVADNLAATDQAENPATNWGGYDAVNRYGDEDISSSDFSELFIDYPGMGVIYRTGYEEKYLVDYDVENYKINLALHYRFKPDVESSFTYNFGAGTTVYQGDNRYSLKNLRFHQFKYDVGKRDKWFVRAYHTRENVGESYDAVFTALLLQNVKTDLQFAKDYSTFWLRNVQSKVYSLPGYPNPKDPAYADLWDPRVSPQSTRDSIRIVADQVMLQYEDSMLIWHAQAREFADGFGNPFSGSLERYEVGTEPFDTAFQDIVSKETFLEGGSKFFDKSSLTHVQGEYKFTPEYLDITIGGNARLYTPNSRGTIFLDTSGTKITNWEIGAYAGVQRKLIANKLILTAIARVDKNENFDPLVSPAASTVYKINPNNTVRFSFSSAIRNPTLQDQYLHYNVGRAILLGNLEGFDNLVDVDSFTSAFSGLNYVDSILQQGRFDVEPVRPEKVKSIEFGYKGIIFKKVFVDASYYYSWYNDFLGYIIGIDTEIDTLVGFPKYIQAYRVSANSSDLVTTQGFSIGMNYYFAKGYQVNGNYSWNVLDRRGSEDPIIPAFNTPAHKFNLGISGSDLAFGKFKYFGFNVNYKWIQGFLFEGSPQFTGEIPSYDMLDVQVNYRVPKIYTTFKLGATNILNKMNFQTYGGPRVGRMIYASILFEIDKI